MGIQRITAVGGPIAVGLRENSRWGLSWAPAQWGAVVVQQAELFFDLLVLPDALAHEVPLLQIAARVEGSDGIQNNDTVLVYMV